MAHQGLALRIREGAEPQVGVAMAVLAGHGLPDPPAAVAGLRAKDAQEEQGHAVGQGQQALQQLQRGGVRPVEVLADDDQGALFRRALDRRLHGAEREPP